MTLPVELERFLYFLGMNEFLITIIESQKVYRIWIFLQFT